MKTIFGILLSLFASFSIGQPLADSFKPSNWNLYIFVSTRMPRHSLVTLAREAAKAKATLVFNGFGTGGDGPENLKKLVFEVNAVCCDKQEIAWVIHPKLFEHYAIGSTPSFVMAYGPGNREQDFISVQGDMTLANALKFFAQESKVPALRNHAFATYENTYKHE